MVRKFPPFRSEQKKRTTCGGGGGGGGGGGDNNQPYLVRITLNSTTDKPVAIISGSNWNLQCWFLWWEENRRNHRKTFGARTTTNNKL